MTATRIAMLVLALGLGCQKRAGAPTSADAAPPSGSARVDALAEAQAELAANAAELNSLGVQIAWGRREKNDEAGRITELTPPAAEPPAIEPEAPGGDPGEPSKPAPATNRKKPEPTQTRDKDDDDPKSSESTPCQRICTLAGVACDLSKRICQLADDHEGDARYEDACWNAGQQCEDASDACSDCTAC